MNMWTTGFLLLFFLSDSTGQTGEERRPLTFIPVSITQTDLKALDSSWPINRRFYGLLTDQIKSVSGGSVYFDLAFPARDFLHPESDLYWYTVLTQYQNVHVLAPAAPDSLLMGQFPAPRQLFFPPFPDVIKVTDRGLVCRNLPGTDPSLANRDLWIPWPESAVTGPSFTGLITGQIRPDSADYFIFADLPGLTSYVVHPGTQESWATGRLYAWSIQSVRDGRWAWFLPDWVWILSSLGLIALASLIVFMPNRQHRLFLTLLVAGSILVPVLARWTGYHVPALIWLFPLLPLIPFLFHRLYVALRGAHQDKAPSSDPVPAGPDPSVHRELTDLKYKLRFYEDMSSNQPPAPTEGPDGLWYDPKGSFADLIGRAAVVASSDISVMILGESGTGKERLARFIHDRSARAKKPFIAVNCASFNENLIESELFGYEKGAFTGAIQTKPGRFELADGGTLFLDEIGETPPAFQVRLLRVLQEGLFERVGGVSPIRVSARIITATHQHLPTLISQKTFREDLYFRLNGLQLTIPPLRERKSDIGLIFNNRLALTSPETRFSPALVDYLQQQPWPGNIRQLLAATDRAILNARIMNRTFLLPDDFELGLTGQTPSTDQMADSVLAALRDDRFRHRSFTAAATSLNLHRVTITDYFRGWVIRYTCQNPDFRTVSALLAGVTEPESMEKLQERVREYQEGIFSRIDEGLAAGETVEQLIKGRFKNLPSFFLPDLQTLIDRRIKP